MYGSLSYSTVNRMWAAAIAALRLITLYDDEEKASHYHSAVADSLQSFIRLTSFQ